MFNFSNELLFIRNSATQEKRAICVEEKILSTQTSLEVERILIYFALTWGQRQI